MIGFEDFDNFSIGSWVSDGLTRKPRVRSAKPKASKRGQGWAGRVAIAASLAATSTALTITTIGEHLPGIAEQWAVIAPQVSGSVSAVARSRNEPAFHFISEAAGFLRPLSWIPINPLHDAIVDQLVTERLSATTTRLISTRR